MKKHSETIVWEIVGKAFKNPELKDSNLSTMITFINTEIHNAFMREADPVVHFEWWKDPKNDLNIIQTITNLMTERIYGY